MPVWPVSLRRITEARVVLVMSNSERVRVSRCRVTVIDALAVGGADEDHGVTRGEQGDKEHVVAATVRLDVSSISLGQNGSYTRVKVSETMRLHRLRPRSYPQYLRPEWTRRTTVAE